MSLAINSYLSTSHLNRAQKTQSAALRHIATGLKIGNVQDNPAAYAILSKLNVNVGATAQHVSNVQNTNAMLSTAAGGIENVMGSLESMRSSLTNMLNDPTADTSVDTGRLQSALSALSETTATTQYNGMNLLDGSRAVTMPDGEGYSETQLPNFSTESLGLTDQSGKSTFDLSSREGIGAALDTVYSAMDKVLDQQTTIGAMQQNLEFAADNYTMQEENQTASASTMGDANIAKSITDLKSANAQSQLAMFAQTMNMHNNYSVLKLLQ